MTGHGLTDRAAGTRPGGGLRRVWFFQPRTQAKAHYSNGYGREQTWTPWFACFLAGAVRAAGLEPGIIDARTGDGWRARIAGLGDGDVLAASVMTGAAITDALEASATARSRGAYVVWGGPHVTLFPAQSLGQSPAHAVIPGFGFAGLPPDLDVIADWEPYVNPDVAIAARTVSYVTSEGCLRRCTFCSEPQTSGNTWYVREVDRSVATIADMIARSRSSGLKLHDPSFFHDEERSGRFAARFAARAGLPWAASLHPADLQAMPDERLGLLAASGLCRVLMGLETPVPALVKLSGKRYDPAGIPQMARRLAGAGIRGMFTFIVGWPGADAAHYQQTIDAAFAIRDVWAGHQCKIHFLEPWPGTPVYKLLQRQGGLACPGSLEDWARIDYYQAQYAGLHDPAYTGVIRRANERVEADLLDIQRLQPFRAVTS